MKELTYSSASELAQAIRTKRVSAKEVVEAHLRRIEAVNPKLNAVVQLTSDAALDEAGKADRAVALGEAIGPLHGVPITIKDSLETAGVIFTAGTTGRASFVPTQDATVVARLRSAGAILLGKTNLPELSMAWESDNLVYGRTSNPYDLSRTPGGSSGGEAAIIAAGGSPLGIGADSAGSIRQPAHFCGIAGIKPTPGRVPRTGHFQPAGGVQDATFQIGPMARFVKDLILALPIIAGVDWRDPTVVPMPLDDPSEVDLQNLRIAFHTDNGILSPTPETVETVRKIAKTLDDAGLAVEEERPDGIERSHEILRALYDSDGGSDMRNMLRAAGTTRISPLVQRWLEMKDTNSISVADFSAVVFGWDEFRSTMLSFFTRYDAIISPACAYPAMPHGTTFDDDKVSAFSYTETYNLTGWPAVVVRGGTSPEGLPIGVQVVAPPWREDVALAVAQRIETRFGGWQPPLL